MGGEEKGEEGPIQLNVCVVVVVGCAVCVCVHVMRLLATPSLAAFVYMETAMSESENSKLPEVSVVGWTDNRHQPQLTCVLLCALHHCRTLGRSIQCQRFLEGLCIV